VCELWERALVVKERAFGQEHVEVAITLTNLGNAYGVLCGAGRQRDLLERALATKGRAFGPVHVEVVITLTSLGMPPVLCAGLGLRMPF